MPSISSQCLTPECNGQSTYKGLCMKCYSEAKKLVEAGTTTWEALAEMGLADQGETKFARAFKQRQKEQG
jgi:hypothetical protein